MNEFLNFEKVSCTVQYMILLQFPEHLEKDKLSSEPNKNWKGINSSCNISAPIAHGHFCSHQVYASDM